MINQVTHGDCLIEMQKIPDKSIDMILCDLPYELIGLFQTNNEELFIGYKAPARLYDLEQDGKVEGRALGKYKVWKIK